MTTPKPSVFIDADVLIAAAASPSTHGASTVVLTLGEIRLLDCVSSQQAVIESERNITKKMPTRLPELQLMVHRCLRVIDDPLAAELVALKGSADPKDLPLLVAAMREGCEYFLTFNIRHYYPKESTIRVLRPGDFLTQIRTRLSGMS